MISNAERANCIQPREVASWQSMLRDWSQDKHTLLVDRQSWGSPAQSASEKADKVKHEEGVTLHP